MTDRLHDDELDRHRSQDACVAGRRHQPGCKRSRKDGDALHCPYLVERLALRVALPLVEGALAGILLRRGQR